MKAEGGISSTKLASVPSSAVLCDHKTVSHRCVHLTIFFNVLILEREGKGERVSQRENHRFVVPLIYTFISSFLYVS